MGEQAAVRMPGDERKRPAASPGRGEVPAVAAAIRILRHLAASRAPLGVTPLARALGLNTSTCFNILHALAQGELVRIDPEAKSYTLDFGLVDLARAAFAQGAKLGQVQPLLRQLALRHGVTVTFWRPAGPDRMVLTQVAESDQVMRIRMGVGQRLPLLIGAMGRVAAAFGGMEAPELRRRFEALRWQRPFSFEEFMRQVEETRQRGWALDEGHYVLGVTTLSAPVMESDQLSVVSASMFGVQHGPAMLAQIGEELTALAANTRRALVFD
ncbi:IclR family transcriptional regulator [Belnapia sp. T6]|uniref:IclR family transcriptional regulator n=1 Tax=Belnapia mucosa TaxID=2804532 RepID=A0ABS1V7Q8_9PROT|nr:IclR family transcriptional regulator [Belnapia mucosa]MBL6457402.1 IclR family transcriptional regulator [Belnapia mucosa]